MADIKNHATLGTSLVHYWDMEESSGSRYDLVGSVNLDDVNTVGTGTGKYGKSASAVEGSSENLRTASAISSTFNGISALSFNFWMKTTDTTNYNWCVLLHDGTKQIGFQRYTSTWTFRNYTSSQIDSPTISASTVEDGNWHMITGVYDGSKVRIYLDGTQSGTGTTQTGTTSIGSSKLGIFARPYDDAGPFTAEIDEVGLWTKALSDSEVTALYNSGSGLPYYDPTDVKNDSTLSTSLVSYWDLNETSGTRVDAHGNNDLTANGTGGVGYATGKLGNAADIELSDSDYLSIADASQTGLDFTGDFSFSFWFNQESQVNANFHALLAKRRSDGSQGAYLLGIQDSESPLGNFQMNIWVQNSSGTLGQNIYAWEPSLSTWYHVVNTTDISTGENKWYINGVLVDTGTLTNSVTSMRDSDGAFTLGAYDGGNYRYDGLIDEVAVYSKILTQAEVRALYGYGTPPEYEAAGAATGHTKNMLLLGVA